MFTLCTERAAAWMTQAIALTGLRELAIYGQNRGRNRRVSRTFRKAHLFPGADQINSQLLESRSINPAVVVYELTIEIWRRRWHRRRYSSYLHDRRPVIQIDPIPAKKSLAFFLYILATTQKSSSEMIIRIISAAREDANRDLIVRKSGNSVSDILELA
jgi:hypothetical protein